MMIVSAESLMKHQIKKIKTVNFEFEDFNWLNSSRIAYKTYRAFIIKFYNLLIKIITTEKDNPIFSKELLNEHSKLAVHILICAYYSLLFRDFYS
jgi:hypothetical protein